MNGALVSCSDYFRFPKRKTSQLHATNRLVEIMFFLKKYFERLKLIPFIFQFKENLFYLNLKFQ